jgi:hypothetical protein
MSQSVEAGRSPPVGPIEWTVAAALAAAVYFDVTGTSSLTSLGSFNLTATDAAIAVMLAALGRLAFRRAPQGGWLGILLLAFAAIIGLNVLRGVTINPSAALTGLRGTALYAGFLVLAAYVSYDPTRFRRVRTILLVVGLAFCALLAIRLAVGPTTFMRIDADNIEPGDEGRGLTARAALIIGLAAVLQVSRLFDLGRRRAVRALDIALLLLLLVGLLATRQATATIASAAGLVVVFALERGPRRVLRLLVLALLAASVLAALLVAPEITTRNGLQDLLPEFLVGNISAREINLGFRQDVWNGFMLDFPRWSLFDQLFGLPSGQRPLVVLQRWGGVYWNFGLHSQYFAAIANAGVIGLGIFVVTIVGSGAALAARSFRSAAPGFDPAPLGAALCAISLVYGYGYDLNNDHGIIVLLVVLAIKARRATAPAGEQAGQPVALTT